MRYLVVFLLINAIVFAHLENGIDKEAGPYLLDIGWEPAAPSAGQPVFFAINIKDTEERTDFDKVWVRFSKGDRIAFAGTMAMDNGSTSFSYEFPEAGDWDMDMKFANYSEKIEVQVPGEKPGSGDGLMLAFVAGAALMAGLALALKRISRI
jgi:hypothetical protein